MTWQAKEEVLYGKILNKEELTEDEVRFLVDKCAIECESGDDHRWQREMTSIIQIGDRFFSIPWMEGLTEMQDSSYYDQPEEVKKHTYEKTLTITKWIPVNGGD